MGPLESLLHSGLAGVTAFTALGGEKELRPISSLTVEPVRPAGIVVPGNFEANSQAAGLPRIKIEAPGISPTPSLSPETTPLSENQATENLALVRLAPDADFGAVTYHIRQFGGTVTVELPGFGLIGNLPANLELTDSGILGVQRQPFTTEALAQIEDPTFRFWAEGWNQLKQQPYISQQAIAQTEEALVNDALEVPPEEKPAPQVSAQEAVGQPDFYQTSEFALGRVAVDIVTPESTGPSSTEDWTQEELTRVLAENFNAFHWLATRYPSANLTFVLAETAAKPIPVSREPINGRYTDQFFWISEAMQQKGFTQGSYFQQVWEANNALRNQYRTLWGFTMFVVDSSNDADNKFTDGYFAYAYLGGPFLVMTSENNGYGGSNMDAVAAHEIFHIFWVLDQYSSAYQPCTRRSGYLNVENQNSQYGSCLSNVTSIMRGQTYPFTYGYQNPAPAGIDDYGAGQAGWRDTWKVDCQANQWVSGSDKLLEPAGGLCYQATILPSGVISVTTEIKTLASAVINLNGVLHLNQLEGVWAQSQGKFFQAQELGLSPDGQQLVALIPVPAGQQYVDLCFGTVLGNPCYRIVGGQLFLPIIEKDSTPPRP